MHSYDQRQSVPFSLVYRVLFIRVFERRENMGVCVWGGGGGGDGDGGGGVLPPVQPP